MGIKGRGSNQDSESGEHGRLGVYPTPDSRGTIPRLRLNESCRADPRHSPKDGLSLPPALRPFSLELTPAAGGGTNQNHAVVVMNSTKGKDELVSNIDQPKMT
jgi:hypothetical protein